MALRSPAILLAAFTVVGAASRLGAGTVAAATAEASPEALRAHVAVLASDAFAGRAPGSAGGRATEAYIVAALRARGVEPVSASAGYLQAVPLHGSTPSPETGLQLITPCAARWLALRDDVLLYSSDITVLPQLVPVVFVGYGIVAPEFDYNDYAALDVTGKVVAFLEGEPPSRDPSFFSGRHATAYGAVATKQRIAASRGAAGSLLIPSADATAWSAWQRLFAHEDLTLPYTTPGGLNAVLSPAAARGLFCGADVTLDEVLRWQAAHTMRSFHLPAHLRARGSFQQRDFQAANVVGLVRGRDPGLADSYVVVSAHHDHLGVGPPVDGDAIYNGAIDNASGVAAVIEIAAALAAAPPRRSVLFLLPTAEERGLLGSIYFLDHSPVPLGRIVANVNVDGLAFFDRFRDVIGIGADLSTLGATLQTVAEDLGLSVARPPDVFEHSQWFACSDQEAFARAGVPAILINEGFAAEHHDSDEALAWMIRWGRDVYHSPADDLSQPIDWTAAAQHASVVLELVRAIADDPTPPRWLPGSPYRRAPSRRR